MATLHTKRGMSATGAFKGFLNRYKATPMGARVGALALVIGLIMLLLPSPYVVESPGPTQDVLGKSGDAAVIKISGVTTYKDSGSLLMTTVNAVGVPGYPVTNAQVLWAWFDSHSIVMPREAIFPEGQTVDQYVNENKTQMTSSQDAATSQALKFLEAKGMDVSSAKVSIHVDDIGGPSAGLMYTLGTIDKLTEQNETGGKKIAGTGTMDDEGKVGAIGGIRLKMLGAKRDGAQWFLAPASNCSDVVGHVPSGLRVVKVSTLDGAYQALVAIGQGKASSLPTC
ncbi:YlbL family protein [Bifidobacterium psychraerophilum]|uniref:YlbL family protein n=1 Tax=Bifidobacterium psychraerophilum TaxID=218140 RepID=UPI003DA72004